MPLTSANRSVKARSPAIPKNVKRLAEESNQSPGDDDKNRNENINVANVTSPLKKLKLKLSPGKKSDVSSTSSDHQHYNDSGTSKSRLSRSSIFYFHVYPQAHIICSSYIS